MEQTFTLKITSAIAIGGKIRRPGAIVSLPSRDAVNLLERGKAELHSGPILEAEVETDAADAAAAAAAAEAEAKAKADAEAVAAAASAGATAAKTPARKTAAK